MTMPSKTARGFRPRLGLPALARPALARPALALALATLAASGSLAPIPAAAQDLSTLSCRALWYQRNAVYAEQGYCFKTADAIATFGARCYPPFGKLTAEQQRYVDEVRAWEARKGCN